MRSGENSHVRIDEELASENGAPPIRVVVADDSYLVREFLASLLRTAPAVELAAVCSDSKELAMAIAGAASRRGGYGHSDAAFRRRRRDPSCGSGYARRTLRSALWC